MQKPYFRTNHPVKQTKTTTIIKWIPVNLIVISHSQKLEILKWFCFLKTQRKEKQNQKKKKKCKERLHRDKTYITSIKEKLVKQKIHKIYRSIITTYRKLSKNVKTLSWNQSISQTDKDSSNKKIDSDKLW